MWIYFLMIHSSTFWCRLNPGDASPTSFPYTLSPFDSIEIYLKYYSHKERSKCKSSFIITLNTINYCSRFRILPLIKINIFWLVTMSNRAAFSKKWRLIWKKSSRTELLICEQTVLMKTDKRWIMCFSSGDRVVGDIPGSIRSGGKIFSTRYFTQIKQKKFSWQKMPWWRFLDEWFAASYSSRPEIYCYLAVGVCIKSSYTQI